MSPSDSRLRSETSIRDLSVADYRQLAEFRYRIREFLHFSEEAARSKGVETRQHQLLLAIKGLPEGFRPTVTTLSQRLCLHHNSTVELIDRLVERGAVQRSHSSEDRREVLVELTPHGEELLRQLSILSLEELRVSAPALSKALRNVVQHWGEDRGRSRE